MRTLRRIARDLKSFENGRIPKRCCGWFFLNLQIAYQELLVQEQLDGLYLEEAGGLIKAAMENLREFVGRASKTIACLQKHVPLPLLHSLANISVMQ